MTYRKAIFVPDATYRVLRSFRSASFYFDENELIIFSQDYYDFYDSAFIYEFRSLAAGEMKQWWLAHDAPNDQWQELFQKV